MKSYAARNQQGCQGHKGELWKQRAQVGVARHQHTVHRYLQVRSTLKLYIHTTTIHVASPRTWKAEPLLDRGFVTNDHSDTSTEIL